jgi:hypothetical protein
MYQLDATMKFIHLNMFRASICPSSGVQSSELPHMMCSTVTKVWCCGDESCGETSWCDYM